MSWRRESQLETESATVRDDVFGCDVSMLLPVDSAAREIVEFVLRATVTEYNIPLHTILGDRRNKTTVTARHVAMFLVYTWTRLSLVGMGVIFNRDHSTVYSALDKMKAALDRRDMELIDKMLVIEARLIEKYRKKIEE